MSNSPEERAKEVAGFIQIFIQDLADEIVVENLFVHFWSVGDFSKWALIKHCAFALYLFTVKSEEVDAFWLEHPEIKWKNEQKK